MRHFPVERRPPSNWLMVIHGSTDDFPVMHIRHALMYACTSVMNIMYACTQQRSAYHACTHACTYACMYASLRNIMHVMQACMQPSTHATTSVMHTMRPCMHACYANCARICACMRVMRITHASKHAQGLCVSCMHGQMNALRIMHVSTRS